MPPPTTHSIPPSLPLTLIVATTPIRVSAAHPSPDQNQNEGTSTTTRLGIGLKGTLPWPRIKADMSFFARVTSRPPTKGTTNAIIMGRKTYDSVPKHLRPLGKRISVVITRDQTGSVREGVLQELEARKAKMAAMAAAKAEQAQPKTTQSSESEVEVEPDTDAIVTPSLEVALEQLDKDYGEKGRLGKVFVIGGAEIYGASLRGESSALRERPVRIVMTHVVRKPVGEDGKGEGVEEPFECDTFFPVERFTVEDGWRSASSEEVTEWVGEEVTGEWKREGDVEVRMVGYERVN